MGAGFVTREDGKVMVRDARTLRALRTLPGRTVFPEREAADIDLGMPDGVALAPGGATLAAGGEDGTLRITDVRSRRLRDGVRASRRRGDGRAVRRRKRPARDDRRRRARARLGR